jgi:UDP-N-acetylmuramyl pentapeptide phosphotransferase/UDP-N-acetylglucosamine-1-phosphate transferase
MSGVRWSNSIASFWDKVGRDERRNRSGIQGRAMSAAVIALVAAGAAAISAGLIVVLHPLLVRYALAKPNARSSHREPTPQGGGVAVIAAVVIVIIAAAAGGRLPDAENASVAIVLGAAVFVAAVGAVDDLRAIAVSPRLLLQMLAVVMVLVALPADLRLLPVLPWWVERALLAIGCLWFVNLTNFMDGIDWMTVAEVVPLAVGLVVLGMLDALPAHATAVAAALAGAVVGFAPFNRPVAGLFLGDVGSLPIGLLLAWLLVLLGGQGHLAAAVLLPLYYVADATITLLRRIINREPFWLAHRSHFYQRATDNGFSVVEIVRRVFLVNVALVMLAVATVLANGPLIVSLAVLCGVATVAWLLVSFSRGRP